MGSMGNVSIGSTGQLQRCSHSPRLLMSQTIISLGHVDANLSGDRHLADVELSCVFLCICSSVIDQSHGSGVNAVTPGDDSEGDEFEEDEEIVDDSEASDDSDPELTSPRFIQQTHLGMSCVLASFLS